MKHLGVLAVSAVALLALGVGTAAASDNFTTSGAAHQITMENRSNVYDLVSNTSNADPGDDYSYLTKDPNNTTFGGLTNLSTDYFVQAGNCGGGSPRFSLSVDMNNDHVSDGHIFVYLGDAPSFSCSAADHRWVSTGNLLGGSDARFDSAQLADGAYGQTYAQTAATFGAKKVLAISLVVDGGWAVGGNQDVLVDDAMYDTHGLGNPGGAAVKTPVPTRHHVYDLDSNTGNVDPADDYSAVTYTQNKKLLLNNLNQLSTDYSVQTADCGGGSPRFSLSVDMDNDGDSDGHIFVYLGDTPNFGCASAFQRWQSTGNLTTNPDLRVDTSQLPGGQFYDTFAHAKTLYGAKALTAVSFVVDAGWAFPGGDQDVWIDDLNVNGATLT